MRKYSPSLIPQSDLLAAIDLNAARSYSELGSSIKTSKETARNRLLALEHSGIISGYIAVINLTKLGYTAYGVYLQTKEDKQTKIDSFELVLEGVPQVFWTAELAGHYDYLIGILARNIAEFYQIFTRIEQQAGISFGDSSVSTRIQVSQFPRSYLKSFKARRSNRNLDFGADFEPYRLDSYDREILLKLSENGRSSVSSISEGIGLSRTATDRRIKLLESEGIVKGYSAIIHPERYGFQIYRLLIKFSSKNQSYPARLFTFCKMIPFIVFFSVVVASWDLEVTCEVPDNQTLQNILRALRKEFKGVVKDIEVVIVIDHFKKYRLYA